MTLASHSRYWIFLMNPASSNRFTPWRIASCHHGWKRLIFCCIGLLLSFILRWCSTIEGSSPIMSECSHTKISALVLRNFMNCSTLHDKSLDPRSTCFLWHVLKSRWTCSSSTMWDSSSLRHVSKREAPLTLWGEQLYTINIFRLFEIGKRGKWGGHNHGLKNLDVMSKYRILEVVDTFQTYCKLLRSIHSKPYIMQATNIWMEYVFHSKFYYKSKPNKLNMKWVIPLLITRQNQKDGLGLTWSNHCPQTLSFFLVCHIELLETLVVYFQ